MAKRVQFGSQTISVPDDATPEEVTQAVFESRATPEGLGVAAPSGVDAREAFRQRAAAGMQEIGSGVHPTEGYSPAMEALQPFYGAAKGAANTILGAREMLQRRVPGLRRLMEADPLHLSPEAVERTTESMKPIGMGQKIGYGSEQGGEFFGPGGIAGKAGKLVTVAERVKQGRTAAGAFTKAVRTPVMRDVIKRLLVRGGTEAAATGVLNEAQGGEFATGAVASIGGQAVGGVANKAAPLIKKLLQRRTATVGDVLLGGGILGGGVGGEEYVRRHYSPLSIAKGAAYGGALMGLASPRARGPIIGAFLQLFDRANPGEYVSGKGAKIDSARR